MYGFHRRQSLGFQLSWRIGLISLITLFSLAGMIIIGSLLALVVAQQQLKHESAAAAKTFDLALQDIGSSLHSRAASLGHTGEEQEVIADILQHHPDIVELMLVAPNGTILRQQRQMGGAPTDALDAQPWLASFRAGREIYWGTVETSAAGAPSIHVVVPVHIHHDDHDHNTRVAAATTAQVDHDHGHDHGPAATTAHADHGQGEFAGSLLARVDLTGLWATVASVKVGETGYAYLIDADGNVLTALDSDQPHHDHGHAHTRRRAEEFTGHTTHDMLESSTSPLPHIHWQGLKDDPAIVDAVPLSTVAWLAIVEQPIAEALQPFYLTLAVGLGLILVVFGAVVSVGRFIQGQIILPLVTMRNHVLAFQQGDTQSRLQLAGHADNEMGLLATTFNQMVESVGQTVAAERQAAESERTANAALEQVKQVQQQLIDAQRDALRELSTPLIPITNDVMIMPLIGTIDSGRAQMVLEALLEGVARHKARLVILDITGVAVVDTQVAQALVGAAQAVKLLGAQVMLTGIQPRIAQTLVHLGVDLSGIITRGSLQAGIASALKQR